MTRRRTALPKREPNGRHDRSLDRLVDARSPAEIRRLRDAALAGLRAPEWGTQIGLLLLREKISASQYEAGRRFAILVRQYQAAIGAPGFPATLHSQIAPRGHTDAATEAERHRAAIKHYDEASVLLAPLERGILLLVCDRDASVSTAEALGRLRTGLDALTRHWNIPE